MGQSPNPDWLNQWQGLSQNMLNAWQGLARQAAPFAPAQPPPWAEGFEQWARLFAPGSGAQSETIERIVDSAKGYAAFMQGALAAAANGGGAGWNEAFRSGFGIPGAASMPFDSGLMNAMKSMQGQGGSFLDGLGAMRLPADAGLGELKAWMSLPAFGPAREHQERYQKTAVAWVEYQEALARYNALMLKASQRGFELFEGRLTEREQPGRQIDSLRALYDLWVDAAEDGYAEVALSTEFREAYGALVNAQMRVRSLVQHEIERVSGDLGMPTRSEVDNIGERLQSLRREVRAKNGGSDLARELARLRAEVAALKAAKKPVAAAAEEAPASRAAPTPKASRPKASRPRRARKAAAGKPARRAVAATAPGSFSSRIAKFADASLGRARKPAKPKKKS